MREMASAIKTLQVKGEAAPKASIASASLSATIRVNRPMSKSLVNRPYQLVFNTHGPNEDLTVTALTGPTTAVRKIEHLNRVRTANFGISTMDANFDFAGEPESTFVIEKPHFVLCGLPMGSKEIDHHLYVNETRVGNFKTSAQALYKARRGPRSAKAVSEPVMAMPDKSLINPNTSLPDADEGVSHKSIPPIPPTTPVNYAHYIAMIKPKTAAGRLAAEGGQFHGSIPSVEIENNYIPSDLVKHKKLTLIKREKSGEVIDMTREPSSISTHSIRSTAETVSESVVNNSLTVTTGKGARLVSKTVGKATSKVNYNNPYRNTKHKERMALNGNRRFEFNSLDTYLKYQKQQQHNGRHFMTPRAILRVPKPCSDTFLLQMMYDLNRPMSRRSNSTRYSDIARTKDLEEFVHTRTSSSLSKAQSNIDKYMGRTRLSEKSAKSIKSAKSAATDTIEEEFEHIHKDDETDDQEKNNDGNSTNINGDR